MSGDAGTQLPEHNIDYYHCGTMYPGWLNGKHPIENGQIVDRHICFSWNCGTIIQVQIIKCDTYFLYYLEDTPSCVLRYCSE